MKGSNLTVSEHLHNIINSAFVQTSCILLVVLLPSPGQWYTSIYLFYLVTQVWHILTVSDDGACFM